VDGPESGSVKTIRKAALYILNIACATIAIHYLVITPYELNIRKTAIKNRTMRILKSDVVHPVVILRNIELLNEPLTPLNIDAEVLMLRAANQRLLKRNKDAIQDYYAALSLDERPEIHVQLATMFEEQGNLEKASWHRSRAAVTVNWGQAFDSHADAIAQASAAAQRQRTLSVRRTLLTSLFVDSALFLNQGQSDSFTKFRNELSSVSRLSPRFAIARAPEALSDNFLPMSMNLGSACDLSRKRCSQNLPAGTRPSRD